MACVVYEYQIPDPRRPIPESERGVCGPSGELIPFVPAKLEEAHVVGRTVDELSISVGTYGMGGAGFFGLRLGCEWLVVALRGADDWILAEGRLVSDSYYEDHDRPVPWITDDVDSLSERVVGQKIASLAVSRHSFRLVLEDGFEMVIEETPDNRQLYESSQTPRELDASDDLRRAVFLCPTTEIWI